MLIHELGKGPNAQVEFRSIHVLIEEIRAADGFDGKRLPPGVLQGYCTRPGLDPSGDLGVTWCLEITQMGKPRPRSSR